MKQRELNILTSKGDNAMSGQKSSRKKALRRTVWLTPTLSICAAAALLVFTMAHSGQAQTTSTSTLQTVTQLSQALMSLLPELPIDPTTDPPGNFSNVIPRDFDPGKTNLVQSSWLSGMGCPTNATIALPNAAFTGVGDFSS